jgi:hypothetical protein
MADGWQMAAVSSNYILLKQEQLTIHDKSEILEKKTCDTWILERTNKNDEGFESFKSNRLGVKYLERNASVYIFLLLVYILQSMCKVSQCEKSLYKSSFQLRNFVKSCNPYLNATKSIMMAFRSCFYLI